MKPISFFVEGNPKGQPRPRAFAFKGKARVYDPGTAEGWKSSIAEAARKFKPEQQISQPVFVGCVFILPRPKNHFGTGKRSTQLRPDAPYFCAKKPDLDNYEKAVWDTLVVLGFLLDDALIVHSDSVKLYSNGAPSGCFIRIALADASEGLPFSITEKAPTIENKTHA